MLERALAGADEGDLVGVHHVVGPVLQDEADPRDLVSAQGPLLAGLPEALRTERRALVNTRLTVQSCQGSPNVWPVIGSYGRGPNEVWLPFGIMT